MRRTTIDLATTAVALVDAARTPDVETCRTAAAHPAARPAARGRM